MTADARLSGATRAHDDGGSPLERLPSEVIGRAPIIWNPNAGEKVGVRIQRITRDELEAILQRHGLSGPLYETRSREDALARVERFVEAGAELIIAAGGDGTASAIAARLIGTDVALGILPFGSLMNLARSLGIPRDPVAAAAIIREGRHTLIDAARAGDRVFFEVASIGLSAALIREAQRVSRGHMGALVQALRVLARYRASDFELRIDDRTEVVRGLLVSIANAPYTGFNMTLGPNARMDDGLLDVGVFEGYARSEFLRHALSILAGRRAASPRLSSFVARRVTVKSRRPLPVRADAADCGTTPISVEVIPRAVRFVVPARPGPGAAWGDAGSVVTS